MQANISPDISWVPGCFPFVPSTEVNGEWFVDGTGAFCASLSGHYASVVLTLNGVPGRVRTAVDNTTVSYINNSCIAFVCLSDLVNANSIGNSTGTTATISRFRLTS